MTTDREFSTRKQSQLEQACRKRGLPLTVQRRAIMEALAQRKDHPTADQIFDAVQERLPGVSRTTVYRVLETFVQFGVVQKINSTQARARFDADTARHHHLRCSGCDDLLDLHAAGLDDLPFPDTDTDGFEIHDYAITFTGLCAGCRNLQTTRATAP
jgi:Fur family peroxide stress response transcriptional regulator